MFLKKKKITVTPNVEHCFKLFEKVAQSLPEGEMRDEAAGAAEYLLKSIRGGQPSFRDEACPNWYVAP